MYFKNIFNMCEMFNVNVVVCPYLVHDDTIKKSLT